MARFVPYSEYSINWWCCCCCYFYYVWMFFRSSLSLFGCDFVAVATASAAQVPFLYVIFGDFGPSLSLSLGPLCECDSIMYCIHTVCVCVFDIFSMYHQQKKDLPKKQILHAYTVSVVLFLSLSLYFPFTYSLAQISSPLHDGRQKMCVWCVVFFHTYTRAKSVSFVIFHQKHFQSFSLCRLSLVVLMDGWLDGWMNMCASLMVFVQFESAK